MRRVMGLLSDALITAFESEESMAGSGANGKA